VPPAGYDARWGGRYPPRGLELRRIERVVPLDGKRVLEIGAGNGRLTFQYAPRAAAVLAVDPDPAAAIEGRRMARRSKVANVRFSSGRAERLRPRRGRFDVALFTWSL
jgi:ubiquinone/menaquinone biosynthesis C-methylase UbiE